MPSFSLKILPHFPKPIHIYTRLSTRTHYTRYNPHQQPVWLFDVSQSTAPHRDNAHRARRQVRAGLFTYARLRHTSYVVHPISQPTPSRRRTSCFAIIFLDSQCAIAAVLYAVIHARRPRIHTWRFWHPMSDIRAVPRAALIDFRPCALHV